MQTSFDSIARSNLLNDSLSYLALRLFLTQSTYLKMTLTGNKFDPNTDIPDLDGKVRDQCRCFPYNPQILTG